MSEAKSQLEVLAMPIKGCSYEQSWQAAFDVLCRQLDKRYEGRYEAKFIELFSPESFQYPEIMSRYQKGELSDPVVLVDGEVIQNGEKLAFPKIRKRVGAKLEEAGIS